MQLKVMEIRLIAVNIHEDAISWFVYTQIISQYAFKMSAFVRYSLFAG